MTTVPMETTAEPSQVLSDGAIAGIVVLFVLVLLIIISSIIVVGIIIWKWMKWRGSTG